MLVGHLRDARSQNYATLSHHHVRISVWKSTQQFPRLIHILVERVVVLVLVVVDVVVLVLFERVMASAGTTQHESSKIDFICVITSLGF